MTGPIVDRDRLTAAVAAVPDRLAAAARAASPEPPAPGEWTPSEVVRHLISVELEVWHPRLAQLAAEDHPLWPWVEPGPWAGEPAASLDRLLETYADARRTTVATLTGLDDAGWAKTGTHATFGVLDAGGLMVRALDHDEEHLGSFGPASEG
jgi:DinB superfamily